MCPWPTVKNRLVYYMMYKILLILFTFSCARTGLDQKYNRKEWKHWIDSDRDCLDTRNEILHMRSKISAKLNARGCKVVSGIWEDYYYPTQLKETKMIDIDHLIPLKNAHENGGFDWTQNERAIFANDPENLVITNRSYNRKKGAKGIDSWLPVHKIYACKYIHDWIKIKKKYRLKITNKENLAIQMNNCK